MHVYSERSKAEIQHVYLHRAAVLRPDLATK
jgi:chorismate mutase